MKKLILFVALISLFACTRQREIAPTFPTLEGRAPVAFNLYVASQQEVPNPLIVVNNNYMVLDTVPVDQAATWFFKPVKETEQYTVYLPDTTYQTFRKVMVDHPEYFK